MFLSKVKEILEKALLNVAEAYIDTSKSNFGEPLLTPTVTAEIPKSKEELEKDKLLVYANELFKSVEEESRSLKNWARVRELSGLNDSGKLLEKNRDWLIRYFSSRILLAQIPNPERELELVLERLKDFELSLTNTIKSEKMYKAASKKYEEQISNLKNYRKNLEMQFPREALAQLEPHPENSEDGGNFSEPIMAYADSDQVEMYNQLCKKNDEMFRPENGLVEEEKEEEEKNVSNGSVEGQ